jgi:hypothetical protein
MVSTPPRLTRDQGTAPLVVDDPTPAGPSGYRGIVAGFGLVLEADPPRQPLCLEPVEQPHGSDCSRCTRILGLDKRVVIVAAEHPELRYLDLTRRPELLEILDATEGAAADLDRAPGDIGGMRAAIAATPPDSKARHSRGRYPILPRSSRDIALVNSR